jgi:hypothetical protein
MARRVSMPAPAALLERPVAAIAAREVVWPPEVDIHESARPLMTPEVVDVLAEFVDLFIEDAHSKGVVIDKLEVRGTFDPEDDTSLILTRLWTRNLTWEQAREYYCAFGDRAQAWFDALDESRQETFIANVSFQVRSITNENTV